MYYKLKYGENYIFKILVLVLVSVLAEYAIWWAMVREESVDWIAGQIYHTPWAYVVTLVEEDDKLVTNVEIGYEVVVPSEWTIDNKKHPYFYLASELDANDILCEIKSDVIKGKDIKTIVEEENFSAYDEIYTNNFPSIKKENTTEEKNFIYDLKIEVKSDIVSYTLFSDSKNKVKCRKGFESIRKSWFYYPEEGIF